MKKQNYVYCFEKAERWIILLLPVFFSCRPPSGGELQDGLWRGELAVQDRQAPFLFEVNHAGTDSATLTLFNGEEKVLLAGIRHESDTAVIPIEAYDAVIKAGISGNRMEGRFTKNYVEHDTGIPFRAERGNLTRFEAVARPVTVPVDGRWDIYFIGANDTTRNTGLFRSGNGTVTGSILTRSGDLRYLEGALTETGVRLSAFSGQSPYLIEWQFTDGDTFEGAFYTARGRTVLRGVRNGQAAPDDAYSLTRMKDGFRQLHFRLPDTDGNLVSLGDERYRGKVVIVSILGSWCPNCLDETSYLSPWYKANKDRGVEIVGLAFERRDDFAYAKTAIDRLRKTYAVDYAILYAGQVGAATVARVLPEIESFSSYPTTIFIDRQGTVRKIHTGYSGPATGLFYEAFKKEFNELTDQLLSE
ncbi:MAG: TlpA family protein disulfide reductase [Tannerella sp.]|jgi:thiol-disulfide isomerase/thioredoxin|nr:TlpA family protein disulfide reductase [Tannerella sp.]